MFYRSNYSRLRSRTGFTLIEMAIVLGVVGILAAGLYRLVSNSNQQTKDLTTAQQQQTLISAVNGFLASQGGQTWLATLGAPASVTGNIPLPTSSGNCTGSIAAAFVGFCDYLPAGFFSGTANPYGQNYTIQVLKDNTAQGTPPNTYSFMIIAAGTAASPVVIPDTDGGRISNLIGGDGGFIYTSTSICGSTTPIACGTMGAWTASATATYGFTSAPAGAVASRTFVPYAGASGNTYWLARQVVPGNSQAFYSYNTMSTALFMGTGEDLYLYPDDNKNGPPALPTAGSGTNNIHLYNGALIVEGTTPSSNGSIQLGIGSITGSGLASSTGAQGQLYLTSSANILPLITLSAPCSALALGGCQAAIQINHGDIYLSNGQVSAQKLYSTSDARFKKNIHPIDDPLGHLMQIDAVAFSLKSGGSESMGVTAQNLEKTYPQLVSERDGVKSVEYNGLIGPLIGAVQELKRQNDDLREQLRQQKLHEDQLEGAIKKTGASP